MNATLDSRNVRPAGPPLAELSDEELLTRYRDRGDRRAFEELVHRYEGELYSYLARYLGDQNMAEDAFQQTFLQVYLKSDQFQTDRRVRPWLYTIATNQAIDAQRRAKRRRMVSLEQHRGDDADLTNLLQMLASEEGGPAGEMEAEERRKWVQDSLQQLPAALRELIVLVYYQGLKYREAAEVLNIPVGTVKSRLHSAILKLNEMWRRDFNGKG